MNQRRRWITAIVSLICLVPVLIATNLLALRLAGNEHTVLVGFRADRYVLDGVFKPEEDVRGIRYRWTQAESAFHLDSFVAVPRPIITLAVGGIPHTIPPPRMVTMQVDDTPWLTLPIRAESRRYALLLPPDSLLNGRLHLRMRGDASSIHPDPREVSFRLDRVTISWEPGSLVLPTWHTLLVQWAIAAVMLAIGWRLQLSRRSMLLLAAGLALLLGGMTGFDTVVAATWQRSLLVASLALLLLVWAVFPRLTWLLPGPQPCAELRLLLLLTLAAMGVRLLAALYPTFDSHDWYIHEDRLRLFQFGSILLFDKPAEFSRRLAIVPPAFYVLVAPLTLFTSNTVPPTQGLYAFLDGCAALLLAFFVRQIGGSARAAWLALLALAFLPIQLTALWWGFGPQVIGQALFLLLVVLVAHQRINALWLWLVAGVVCTVMVLTHNGVALLCGFCLAVYVALAWWRYPQEHRHWLGWGLLLVASGIIALLLLYIDVVALQLQGVANNNRLAFTEEDIFRVKWTLGSLCVSFQPLGIRCDQYLEGLDVATVLPQIGATLPGVLLPAFCLFVVVYLARGLHRWLVVAWLVSAGVFFAVDLAFGLQVRYAYFVTPLVCVGLALLLDRLAVRHRLGWLLAWCLIGLVVIAGLTLWWDGVVSAIQPSLRLLTH